MHEAGGSLPRPGGRGNNSDGAGEAQTVLIWTHHTGERLTFPLGWHRLPPPEPGETLADYGDRAIFGHPLVRDILSRGAGMPDGLKRPSLAKFCPKKRTPEWWKKHYPLKVFHWETDSRRQCLEYYLELIVRRLEVELVDRLKACDLVMKGLRTGLAEGPEERTVPPRLLSDPDMVLRLSAGEFGPEQRPSSLPSFIELTLMPAETPAAHRLDASEVQPASAAVAPTSPPRRPGRRGKGRKPSIPEIVEAAVIKLRSDKVNIDISQTLLIELIKKQPGLATASEKSIKRGLALMSEIPPSQVKKTPDPN